MFLAVLHRHALSSEKLESPDVCHPSRSQGDTLPSCFNAHPVNKCPFCGLFSSTFFTFFFVLLLLVIALSKIELSLYFLALDVSLEKSEGSLDFLP